MNDLNILIGIVGVIVGLSINYSNYRKVQDKNIKSETKEEASESSEIKTSLAYISKGVDDIRIDIKANERRVSELSERVTRVEESTKSAHHRLNEYIAVKEGEV